MLIELWQNNKAFTSFQGREVSLFIESIPKIVAFLRENIVVSEMVQNIIYGLEVWKGMVCFLTISAIEPNGNLLYQQK